MLILIYVLVVGWFKSFTVPLAIMTPIPLTLVGILPAHAMLGDFFTATSMIGFIAGAGIIVRNSILVVDFIELRRQRRHAAGGSGDRCGRGAPAPGAAHRGGVIVGASVIVDRPIFQGLGLSLIAGGVASTFLSWPAVPVLYYMLNDGKRSGPGNPLLRSNRRLHYDGGTRGSLLAGVMVLASLALAHWVSPDWLWLTAFVGLNLLQSAIHQLVPGHGDLQMDGSAGTQQGDAVSQLSNGTN